MWGLGGGGGKCYWGRRNRNESGQSSKPGRGGGGVGIVVVFAWMSNNEEEDNRELKPYVDLYSSLGWDALICHSQFLNSFFPDKAALLALEVLDELVKEIMVQPGPIVFASFSGAPKACMYKVIQIIDGKSDVQSNSVAADYYCAIRDCIAGHIYDSGPVDFASEMGTRFILRPSAVDKPSRSLKLATYMASGIATGLDTLFLNRFGSQWAEFWHTLYSSVNMRAPYLILCSEDDHLAPCQTICNFAQRLEELGGDVTLVKWVTSPHSGHYIAHPDEYQAAVARLLDRAESTFSRRVQQLVEEEEENMELSLDRGTDLVGVGVSKLFCHLRTAAARLGFPNAAGRLDPAFVTPGSSNYQEGGCERSGSSSSSSRGTWPKEGVVRLPSINPHGVLGQALFDMCVPENVEDWDIRRRTPSPSSYAYAPTFLAPNRRNPGLNAGKCIIKRSRL